MTMEFGSINPRVLTHILFWTGLVAIASGATYFGISVSATTEWSDAARIISDSMIKPYSHTVYNVPLAIALSCGITLVLGVIWRLFCEFCYLKLQFLHKSISDKA